MANTAITELDFFTNKAQLISFLQGQSQFKDYNFEGSNLNVLLDVLAYNTYLNNFYTNMAVSEMFLDSAQLRNSVVSRVKELNYLPKSATSAMATVRVTFQLAGAGATVTIPKNTKFVTNYSNTNYTFVTAQTYVAYKTTGNTYVADNVEIFEGYLLTDYQKEGFYVSSNSLKCVLTNTNVDVSSIEVFINDVTNQYKFATSIYGVANTDNVFYVEPYFDEQYAVVFGQNVYGNQPASTDTIQISYRVCSGSAPNGASAFTTNFVPGAVVQTITAASGGSEVETIDSMKFFAPKSIQIQDRAVTSTDYGVLLKQHFNDINAISVYGGEELTPPQYGVVAISVELTNKQPITDSKASLYLSYLKDKTPLTIRTIITNPTYMYAALNITVNYSKQLTTKSTAELETLIRSAIALYSNTYLNNFGVTLRMSKLSSFIDNSDVSILGDTIVSRAVLEFSPTFNLAQNWTFNFGAPIVVPYPYDSTNGFTNYYPSVVSTLFYYNGTSAKLQDDGVGNIQIISSDAVPQVLVPSAGTIDYNTGVINLVNFVVSNINNVNTIDIYANNLAKDITAPNNTILYIRDSDVNVSFKASA